MAREELISSAVAFLQDPSVASAPLDKRKAFLEAKNLTPEEVQLAFARAGEDPSVQTAPVVNQASYNYPPQQRYLPPGNGYGYNPYGAAPWPHHQPEPPRRDWRDWFIMGTVTTVVSYGLYAVAKRYVMPLISPPTPPQIEQDKAAIDAEFERAFALIDQLAADTATLKSAEAERTEKLDAALEDMEAAINELKTTNKRREEEARRIGDEVRGLRDMIPKALDGWKADGDSKLKEIGSELKSLKVLVSNRVGGQSASVPAGRPPAYTAPSASGSSTPTAYSSGTPLGTNEKQEESSSAPAPGINAPKRETTSSPFSFDGRPTGRAIPAWQKAAATKSSASSSAVNGDGSADSSESAAGSS